MADIAAGLELISEDWINSPERQLRDQALATSLLVAAAPVIGIAALGHLREEGSFIYSQERVGYGGELFTLHKMRSLKVDTPLTSSYGVDDPRATQLGRILRRTNVDELPQLYNILKGEMTFFGPRPLLELDFDKARLALSRNKYDQWEDVYMRSVPGGVSTFAIATRRQKGIGLLQSWELRANSDIYDFECMSRRHERKLAASIARLGVKKLITRN